MQALELLARRLAVEVPCDVDGAWCAKCGRRAELSVMLTETLGLNYCREHAAGGRALAVALRAGVGMLERRGVDVRALAADAAGRALERTDSFLDRVERLLLEAVG